MPDFGIYAGDTNKTIYVRLRDSTTGLAKTGLAFNSAGAVCSYTLPQAARAAITLATQTVTGAHTDGGFVEVDATNCKGLYRLDLSDAAIASGDYTIISIEFDGIIEESLNIPLHTPAVNVTELGGAAQSATDLKDFADAGYDPATNKVEGVKLVDTTTTNTDLVTAAAIADAVLDEDIADHVAVGTVGESIYKNAYVGPYGLGVYIDDGAANTSTVAGEDGTASKPVSTMAAARTIADAIGITRYYFTATTMTVDATTANWHFVGLGGRDANVINLGSQDVGLSLFQNLTLEGVQGGSARISALDCVLQDGTSTTLHIHAINCGLKSPDPGILLTNNNDHIFENCYSMVAGNGAPMLDTQNGASTGLSMRHYSGGIELKNLHATSTTSIETDGQVIFNATQGSTAAAVTIRGLCTVTDNATMSNVTEGARIDEAQILAEVNAALDTAISELGVAAPTSTPTLRTGLMLLYMALRNRLDVVTTGTDSIDLYNDAGTKIAGKNITDDSTDYSEAQMA